MRSTSPGSRAAGVGAALLHLVFVGAVAAHVVIPFLLPAGARSDFGYFHASAREAVRGGSPYSTAPPELAAESGPPGARASAALDGAAPVVNLNPPFQSVLTAPLGLLPYGPAMWIWYGLGLAAGVLAAFVTARTFLPDRPLHVWGPAFTIGLLLFLPTLANGWVAQLGLVLALVAACTLRLVVRDRDVAAGVLLGLVAGLKLFVGLFAVLFLATRRWRALAAFGATFAGTVLLGGAVLGWEAYSQYLRLLGSVDWHAWSWNVSVFGTVTRMLGSGVSDALLFDLPVLALPLARALALGLGLAYAGLVATRASGSPPVAWRLAVSLTFVMMILLSPLGWLYYLPALLPSCALLVTVSAPGRERALSAAAVAAFVVFSSVPQRPYAGPELAAGGYSWWKAELPVLGLMVLAWAHVRLLSRAPGTHRAQR